MVQVFTVLFFVGFICVLLNFLYQLQKISTLYWSIVRILGYFFSAVSSIFFAMINPHWFVSTDGYTCAVALSWVVPFIEEGLLFFIWNLFKRHSVLL